VHQGCEVCRTFYDEYRRVPALAQALNMTVVFAKVNCDDEEDLQRRFEVTMYPTFKVFRRGIMQDGGEGSPLTGEATLAALRTTLGLSPSSYARSLTSPTECVEWLFNRARGDFSILTTLVGAFPADVEPPAGVTATELRQVFEDAAKLLAGNIRAAVVTDGAVADALRIPRNKPLVLYKDFDEGKEFFAGPWTAQAIAEWARVRNRPIAALVHRQNVRKMQRTVDFMLHVFVQQGSADDMRHKNVLLQQLRGIGERLVRAALCAAV
jgi:protein disulfide-isomerase A1